MPYLSIFGLKLEKTIVIFEIIILEFVKTQSLVQKRNSLYLEPKMPDVSIFGLQF